MKFITSVLIVTAFSIFTVCAQDSAVRKMQTVNKKVAHSYQAKKVSKPLIDSAVTIQPSVKDTALCFPIQKDNLYNVYDYVIFLNDERVAKLYKPFFDKYEMKFSGYVWEVLLKHMLTDADKALAENVVVRSESNKVMVNITRYYDMKMFPDYMCKIFSSLKAFEAYLKSIDRDRVPNY